MSIFCIFFIVLANVNRQSATMSTFPDTLQGFGYAFNGIYNSTIYRKKKRKKNANKNNNNKNKKET